MACRFVIGIVLAICNTKCENLQQSVTCVPCLNCSILHAGEDAVADIADIHLFSRIH
jgi:hypothetical protein